MKHWKRISALMLVLAMLCGYVAAAETTATVKYSDANSITHGEAVDVLSALGIIQGYKNGTFRPTTGVTRAEFSKMLAVLLNKGVDPGDSYSAAATFADTAEHWGRGYIGFCVADGLINGKSATVFDPDGKVTGYEAAKMLLCALGYDAKAFGLIGSNWTSNVIYYSNKEFNSFNNGRTEKGCKLFSELDAAAMAKNLNRDDACQMMLNALKGTMVENAAGGTQVSYNFITIGDSANAVPLEKNAGSDYRGVGKGDDALQLCEELFPALRLTDTANNCDGYPAAQWVNGGTVLGTYQIQKPILTGEANLTAKQIVDAIGTNRVEQVDVYYNGLPMDREYGSITYEGFSELMEAQGVVSHDDAISESRMERALLSSDIETVLKNKCRDRSAAAVMLQVLCRYNEYLRGYNSSGTTIYLGWNGVHTEVFYDKEAKVLTVASQPFYPMQITGIQAEKYDDEGEVTEIGYANAKPIGATPGSNFAQLELNEEKKASASAGNVPFAVSVAEDPEALEKGAYIVSRFGYDPELNGFVSREVRVLSATAVVPDRIDESGGGTLRNFRSEKTTYSRCAMTEETSQNNIEIGKSYTAYTTTFGTVNGLLYLEAGSSNAENYSLVLNAGKSRDTFAENPYIAELLDAKAVKSEVSTDKNYGVDGTSPADYSIKSFVSTTNGKKGLELKKEGSSGTGRVILKNSEPTVKFDKFNNVTGASEGAFTETADNNTIFLIETVNTNGDTVYNAYTGIGNVPGFETETAAGRYSDYAYCKGDEGRISIFYLGGNLKKTASVATNYGALYINGEEQRKVTADTAYYSVMAVVNGKEETLKLSPNVYADLVTEGYGFTLFRSYNVDDYEVVDSLDLDLEVSTFNSADYVSADNGLVGFGNDKYFTYSNNTLVYVYGAHEKKLYTATMEELIELKAGTTGCYTISEEPNNNHVAMMAVTVD